MSVKNIFGVLALVLLGIFLAFTTVKEDIKTELSPDLLYHSIIEKTRYVEVEEIAEMIISEDPILMLIDVRSADEFNKFSLTNAINIPLDSFLLESNQDFLLQDVYKVVFYSNGTSVADQAWILSKRMGASHNFVMKGGLNQWVEHILKPVKSEGPYDRVEDQKYQYRKGASQFFVGGDSEVNAEEKSKSTSKKAPIKRKKKEVEGGCG